jgi:hypothetical protein
VRNAAADRIVVVIPDRAIEIGAVVRVGVVAFKGALLK